MAGVRGATQAGPSGGMLLCADIALGTFEHLPGTITPPPVCSAIPFRSGFAFRSVCKLVAGIVLACGLGCEIAGDPCGIHSGDRVAGQR